MELLSSHSIYKTRMVDNKFTFAFNKIKNIFLETLIENRESIKLRDYGFHLLRSRRSS